MNITCYTQCHCCRPTRRTRRLNDDISTPHRRVWNNYCSHCQKEGRIQRRHLYTSLLRLDQLPYPPSGSVRHVTHYNIYAKVKETIKMQRYNLMILVPRIRGVCSGSRILDPMDQGVRGGGGGRGSGSRTPGPDLQH
jgi:hypothetical protein